MSISCIATNVQRSHSRFPNKEDRPPLRQWRCELTALSHIYNLYFVACIDKVYIYQPSFPDQSLPDKPALVLHPPISAPNLSYYQDRLNPHSITRLHVDFLGREEVVLVTCDDGDVIGYLVSAIQRTIEARQSSEHSDNENSEGDVRTFFHRNVGKSAWGLAIHREARLIAISANTAQVTVIALALTHKSAKEVDQHHEPSTPHLGREHSVLHLLGQNNIPSVSFDNTGADPSGRWLFSCDIVGNTHLWDLHRPQTPAQTIQLGYCHRVQNPSQAPAHIPSPPNHHCGLVAHAVWGAIFIDPRSCHRTSTFKDAFGGRTTAIAPCFWDITRSVRYAPHSPDDLSDILIGADHVQNEEQDSNDNTETSSSHSLETGEASLAALVTTLNSIGSTSQPGIGEAQFDDNSGPGPGYLEAEDISPSENEDDGVGGGEHTEADEHETEILSSDEEAADSGSEYGGLFVPEALLQAVALDAPPVAAGNVYTLHAGGGTHAMLHDFGETSSEDSSLQRRAKKRWYCQFTTADEDVYPTASLPLSIIMTKDELFFLQTPASPRAGMGPIITLHNPHYPPGCFKSPTEYERLDKSLQIPELGIFLVASPGGRCAIFTLTQIETRYNERPQTVYGFRQDYLLPFKEQERDANVVPPFAHLVGIAAGPVQGSLDRRDDERVDNGGLRLGARRWRLMLLYHEQTVLSYEIGKQRDQTPGLADLVV